MAATPTPARPPLPAEVPWLLLVLTFCTGMIDAASYLGLGHTFVANMTGNVVFLGFGLAGAGGLSVIAALCSLAAFLVGAACGGRLTRRLGEPRHRWLVPAVATEAIFVAIAALVAIGLHAGSSPDRRYLVIVLLAFPMGVRNATVKGIGVPDMTTTVLTLTITGLAADSPFGGGDWKTSARKLQAIGAMLVGALAAGLLVIHHHLVLTLLLTAALLAVSLAGYLVRVRGR